MNSMKTVDVHCFVGEKVFKACPKCNSDHNGSCKHCAWESCIWHYCDIEPHIYDDGSGAKAAWQVVPVVVREVNFVHINEEWNISYFATEKECASAIEEFVAICAIADRHERKVAYDEWYARRKTQCELRTKGGST